MGLECCITSFCNTLFLHRSSPAVCCRFSHISTCMPARVFSAPLYPLIFSMCVEGCRGFWEWSINRSGGILWSPSSERPLAHDNDLILITANKKDKLSFCSPQGPRYQLSHHTAPPPLALSLSLSCVCGISVDQGNEVGRYTDDESWNGEWKSGYSPS